VTFQSDASSQGRAFEDVVENNLTRGGWKVLRRRWQEPETLVEIDLVAADPTGQVWWVECKGSWLSSSGRNGAIRTDTTKKLIANAALLSTVPERPPYMLATSDMPEAGSAQRWIAIALREGWLDRCEVVSMFSVRPVTPGGGV
jgi:Holliday junction resolvase-like predicted endonuclease